MQSTILAKSIKQIWPQKELVVEFNDQICNSSSNPKSIGWKLTILEIRPMLTFCPMWTSKIISGWIQWPEIYILLKFQVNRMKIEDFRNTTLVVDLGPILTFWSTLTSKIMAGWIQWPNMQLHFKFQVNRMKIEDFRNLTSIVDLRPLLTFWPKKNKKNNRLLPFDTTIWWSFVMIGLKVWPVGDRQTDIKID